MNTNRLSLMEPAQKQTRKLQSLTHRILDQLPIGVFHKDKEGRYVFVNAWFCRLKAGSAEDFLGRTADEIAAAKSVEGQDHPGQLREIKMFHQGANHHKHIIQSGETIETVEEYANGPGREQYLQVIKGPLFDGDGTIIGSQGVMLDITERKRLEAQVGSERNMLRALMDSSTDAIYFKDRQSRFRRCSAGMASLFKLASVDEAVGKSDFDFQGKEHAQQAFDDEQEIIRTGKPIIGKVEKETWPDGHVTWALTSKMPLCDEKR